MSASSFDPLASALAGRYRIARELGAGGMATVYLAEDVKHGRQVALKVLRDDLTASLGKERFLREISIAAALTHPHILALYDSGEAAGRLFYVMPFVDGQSLRQRLTRTGELPIGEAVRVLRDIADAMAHAHKRNVVHRDLKPENVMLTDRHALVMDFGVAKALSAATGRQVLTTLGVALGTPTYMSPEQATADPQLDHRSDIYSFGVLAYELLTGRTPFEGGSPQEVLARHVTTAAVPVTTHRTSIPPALASLVMRCLEKKPADRWQSAEEMLPQLEALLTPSGGITPHGTAPYAAAASGGRWGWRHPAILATMVLAVASVGGIAYQAASSSAQHAAGAAGDSAAVWIAVLAPQMVGKADTVGFADGLVDEVRGSLVRAGASVKAGRSTQVFKDSTLSLPEIARRLGGVPWIVASKVRWEPSGAGRGRLYATFELLDARTETMKWSDAYDTTLTDLPKGQEAVADRVARDLAGELNITRRSATLARIEAPNVKPEAYTLYQLGRAELNRWTDSSRNRAPGYFRRAASLDPSFAKAYAWLFLSLQYSDAATDTSQLRAAAHRAIALAPDDPDVLAVRSFERMRDWDWMAARKDLESALARDPQDAFKLWWLSELEAALGNSERAIELGRRGASIDPVVGGDLYAGALRMTGRLDEAVKAAQAGLALDSLSTANQWWYNIGYVAVVRGDLDGYYHARERARALRQQDGLRWYEAAALAQAGRDAEARAQLGRDVQAVLKGKSSGFSVAETYASLGERDSAFVWLERFVRLRYSPHYLPISAFLTPLHQDPRWPALLKRVGLR